ncbi:MAG: hypothetical protein MUF72_10250 [Elainella sp. Prado103]|jgi:hypothetical protein|nr:hypothetical protein [Elainella sp. Prado103]
MLTPLHFTRSGLWALGLLSAIVFLLLIARPVQGDCIYEGMTYRTGETVGSLVCMPDGSWQPQ